MPAVKLNLSAPPAADRDTLPSGNSPDLELVVATAEEIEHCILLNFASWAGPLSADAYLRREQHLSTTNLLKNGGLTNWILVSKSDIGSPRTILAACETIRKQALVACKQTRKVRDSWAFGIGNVYCRNEYRGKGYAMRMMAELKKKLEFWQQDHDLTTDFTILYSDIGKTFYAKHGWIPHTSSHVSLPPNRRLDRVHNVRLLRANDLATLCRKDEQLLRQSLQDFPSQIHDFRLAWLPDEVTMAWHHAREQFLASELRGKFPDVKGALIEAESGQSTWCIWSRSFSDKQNNNVLYILRFVVDGDAYSSRQVDPRRVQQVVDCLSAAQEQAEIWGMTSVELWNPSPTILAGCHQLDPKAGVVHRDQESIACLNWYGQSSGSDDIEWVANEKFGWC